MSSRKDEMPGDVVTGQKYSNGSSAADEYYRYRLLQLKLEKAPGSIPGVNKTAISEALSEREAIELQILTKLVAITESSPEFSQLTDITGSRDRYEMARILAETVYDKMRAETILQFYTPPKANLLSHFAARTEASFQSRRAALDGITRVSSSSAASSVASALGGGGGGGD